MSYQKCFKPSYKDDGWYSIPCECYTDCYYIDYYLVKGGRILKKVNTPFALSRVDMERYEKENGFSTNV
jgi:hypothetical protein